MVVVAVFVFVFWALGADAEAGGTFSAIFPSFLSFRVGFDVVDTV